MEVTLSPQARTVVLWFGVIAGGVILLEAAHALRPFAWAIITAYIFHPFVGVVHRKTRLPKHLITTWLYLMLGLLITILIINFAPSLVEQVDGLQEQIPNASEDIETWLEENQRDRLDQLGLEPNFFDERLDQIATEAADGVSSAALPVLFGTFSVAIELLVYLVASFYLIVYGDRLVNALKSALHRRYHGEFDRLINEINSTLGAYIRGQALLVLIMSSASYAALTILDVDYALTIAIATGFLELIPLIGPWAAGAIAVSISLFQDSTPFGWSHLTLALVVGLVYFALRQLEDIFVIPMVIGRIVHLHPLLVIFVLVLGTSIGGVLGLILAVPLAAVGKIIIVYFYGKVIAREVRHVEVIAAQRDLDAILERMPELTNTTLVLLVEPNVLAWADLAFVRKLAETATEHSVALSTVTPDGLAGSLLTAVGIPTTAIPTPAPRPAGSLVG